LRDRYPGETVTAIRSLETETTCWVTNWGSGDER
jgi:hypothetical protein